MYTALLAAFQLSLIVIVSFEGLTRKQAHQPAPDGISSAVYNLLSAEPVLENEILLT